MNKREQDTALASQQMFGKKFASSRDDRENQMAHLKELAIANPDKVWNFVSSNPILSKEEDFLLDKLCITLSKEGLMG